MGYTHHWRLAKKTSVEALKAGYAMALPSLQDIVKRYRNVLTDETGRRGTKPQADAFGVFLNGIDPWDHEPFILVTKKSHLVSGDFCKTMENPYDKPVCEMLLVLGSYIPGLAIDSDGFKGIPFDAWKKKGGAKALFNNWPAAIKKVSDRYGISVLCEGTERVIKIQGCDDRVVIDVELRFQPRLNQL